jgi:membrane-associated phospholipid phosphatase
VGDASAVAADLDADRGHPILAALAVVIVGYLVLLALSVGAGLTLTSVLVEGPVGEWDADTTEWFVEERTPEANGLTAIGSLLAATFTVVGIAVVAAVILWKRGHWREALFLAAGLVLEVSVFLTTTLIVDRNRPDVERLEPTPPTASFFSGHTAAAVVLYLGLAVIVTRRLRNAAARAVVWLLGALLPLGVAVARIYRGMHHPTDVIAAIIVGLGCLAFAVIAVRRATAAADDATERVQVSP